MIGLMHAHAFCFTLMFLLFFFSIFLFFPLFFKFKFFFFTPDLSMDAIMWHCWYLLIKFYTLLNLIFGKREIFCWGYISDPTHIGGFTLVYLCIIYLSINFRFPFVFVFLLPAVEEIVALNNVGSVRLYSQ